MTLGLVVAVVAVLVAGVVVLFFRSLAREQVRTAEAQTRRLQVALDDVKSLAWDHRDIAPELSTIIIDSVRSVERNRPELPG